MKDQCSFPSSEIDDDNRRTQLPLLHEMLKVLAHRSKDIISELFNVGIIFPFQPIHCITSIRRFEAPLALLIILDADIRVCESTLLLSPFSKNTLLRLSLNKSSIGYIYIYCSQQVYSSHLQLHKDYVQSCSFRILSRAARDKEASLSLSL